MVEKETETHCVVMTYLMIRNLTDTTDKWYVDVVMISKQWIGKNDRIGQLIAPWEIW